MNKTLWLHIIFLSIGFLGYPKTYNPVFVVSDSLKVDTSTQISPRNFDDLNEVYTGEDYVYERTIESSGWWTRFKQWLSDFFKDLFSITNEGQASKATDIAIKIAGVIIFLLVIYFIFKAVINKEGTWVFGKSSDKNIIPVTDIENNIHATDFKKLIENAEKENNYRLAIRYYYLWLLKQLTQAEIIEYDVEKTNSDYQNEITQNQIKKEFAYTSYLYNYIWYGEFNVSPTEFDQAKHAFTKFLKSVKA
ncbi:hypothetical protein BWZ22_10730 [Seonamhaeicola sp. S2-3]|uniref:hypothetical protein n=1 Tax=Seonamhaeicola sp. S2-3 TaxID=1936081 RepID=UPI0009727000|nr:hypothetical protein [Seonamhaeicola sp. S2-3]APY11683.1 hypothetical protein BWZ22_10730 [Seonamhaeicola sp. S2-3]